MTAHGPEILMWHVHGSWTTAFLAGGHRVVLPVLPGRGPDGRGRAATWDWPATAREAPPSRLPEADLGLVLAQRPHELELAERWTGMRPGRDVPAVYVEHDTPKGDVPHSRHPLADRPDLTIVHVTHFNALFWDCGTTPTTVIEHGVPDPGHRYTGELARAGVVLNEPLRRGRTTGTDLLPAFAEAAPIDLFGMGVDGAGATLGIPPERMTEHEDPPQARMHEHLARRRVYLHTVRWTSLGLSLIEAMLLGLPVVVVAAAEAAVAVPPGAGAVGTDTRRLREELGALTRDPDRARETGRAARQAALDRYPLHRFTGEWDRLIKEVAR